MARRISVDQIRARCQVAIAETRGRAGSLPSMEGIDSLAQAAGLLMSVGLQAKRIAEVLDVSLAHSRVLISQARAAIRGASARPQPSRPSGAPRKRLGRPPKGSAPKVAAPEGDAVAAHAANRAVTDHVASHTGSAAMQVEYDAAERRVAAMSADELDDAIARLEALSHKPIAEDAS